jgi:membrane protein
MRKPSKLQNFLGIVLDMIDIYNTAGVPRSAAALSYFLTMSLFPILICVHAMVASFATDITPLLESLAHNSGGYVADHRPTTELCANQDTAAILPRGHLATAHDVGALPHDTQHHAIFTGGSAVHRDFQSDISFVFSLLFLGTIYFAIVVMAAGNWFINILTQWLPKTEVLAFWAWLRYPLLFVIFMFIIYWVYRINAPKHMKGGFFPGSIAASVILVLVSMLFSWFVSLSARYPLVYGSLASIIIFMLWMYICGQILIMGNALNVILRRRKREITEKIVDEHQK